MRPTDPRYVIYANGHREPDEHPRCHVVIFPEAYQALTWLERMLGNSPYTRDGDTLLLESGVKVRSDQLDQILGATKQPWKLPDYYLQWILRFKYGSWDERSTVDVETSTSTITEAGIKIKKPPREKRPERPTDFTTISDLVKGTALAPMNARAALRAAGLTKPGYGWAWPKAELPNIRKIIGLA